MPDRHWHGERKKEPDATQARDIAVAEGFPAVETDLLILERFDQPRDVRGLHVVEVNPEPGHLDDIQIQAVELSATAIDFARPEASFFWARFEFGRYDRAGRALLGVDLSDREQLDLVFEREIIRRKVQ